MMYFFQCVFPVFFFCPSACLFSFFLFFQLSPKYFYKAQLSPVPHLFRMFAYPRTTVGFGICYIKKKKMRNSFSRNFLLHLTSHKRRISKNSGKVKTMPPSSDLRAFSGNFRFVVFQIKTEDNHDHPCDDHTPHNASTSSL